jgi:hypothetical protein
VLVLYMQAVSSNRVKCCPDLCQEVSEYIVVTYNGFTGEP